MLLSVAHDLRGRVEPHRLAVEKSCREYVRIEAFDPCRGVDQIGKTRRVAFGKAVFAKTFDLTEAASGKIALIAARRHAIDELFAERIDSGVALGRCHR